MSTNMNYLRFNSDIGRKKPESVRNRDTVCPFCHREELTDILAEDWPMLLIKNKYPVLEDTFQTVVIESCSRSRCLSVVGSPPLAERL